MPSPLVAATNDARLGLQRLYEHYLRAICDLRPSTPRKMLLVGIRPATLTSLSVATPGFAVLEWFGRFAYRILVPHCLFAQPCWLVPRGCLQYGKLYRGMLALRLVLTCPMCMM